MNRTIVIMTCFVFAPGLNQSQGEDRFERIRSPYAAAPPFSQATRPRLEEVSRPPANPPGDEPSARRPDVELLLDELQEARSELHLKLKAMGHLGPSRNGSASPHVERIESVLQSAHEKRRYEAKKTNQLLQRLEVWLSSTKPAQSQIAPYRGSGRKDPAPVSFAASEETGQSDEEDTAEGTPVDIAGDAVDRLRLADALFGQGEFELARDIYLKLRDLSQHTHGRGRVWIEFQLASCYRNLDDIQNAEKYYRMVVGTKEDTDLTDYARWWLDAIQKKKDVERVLRQIRKSVKNEGQENGTDRPNG